MYALNVKSVLNDFRLLFDANDSLFSMFWTWTLPTITVDDEWLLAMKKI